MSPRTARALGAVSAVATVLLSGLLAASVASAADWLPLQVGYEWNYVDDGDEPHLETFTETGRVRGRLVYVRAYIGGIDDGLFNFWVPTTDGSVLLAGYYRPAYPFGLVYEPPIKIFPAAPSVGATWTTHTFAISIPDNAPYAEFDVDMSVLQQVTLTVPAGTFPTFGVGQVPPAPSWTVAPGLTVGLDGRAIGDGAAGLVPGPESATEWYADGVGLVQYNTGVPYQLQSANLPTPAARSSWGRLKQLYR